MAELTRIGIQNIENRLDNSIFTKHAFERQFNSDNGLVVNIEFKDNPSFHFTVEEMEERQRWRVTERPGVYLDSESQNVQSDFSRCISNLNNWLNRLEKEITYRDPNDWSEVARIRSLIEEQVSSIDNPNEPFRDEEAAEWRQKVDQVIDSVESLEEDKRELRQEVNRLKKDLNNLNEQIDSMPRKTWLRSVLGSAANFAEKVVLHKSLGKTLVGAAIRGLLPEADIAIEDPPQLPDGE